MMVHLSKTQYMPLLSNIIQKDKGVQEKKETITLFSDCRRFYSASSSESSSNLFNHHLFNAASVWTDQTKKRLKYSFPWNYVLMYNLGMNKTIANDDFQQIVPTTIFPNDVTTNNYLKWRFQYICSLELPQYPDMSYTVEQGNCHGHWPRGQFIWKDWLQCFDWNAQWHQIIQVIQFYHN